MAERVRRKGSLGVALIAALVAIAVVIGGRWYSYVAYAADPYDEVGIELNSRMPGPIRQMGCDMMKERFENKALPPYGCGVNGRW
jgi:hypothetical protein